MIVGIHFINMYFRTILCQQKEVLFTNDTTVSIIAKVMLSDS